MTSPSGASTSRSLIRWCLAPASVAKVAAVPPAPSTARALTGIPPFAATTARFISRPTAMIATPGIRSEEHTSELQSHRELVCRLLLEKKNEVYRRACQPENKQRQGKLS